MMSFPNTLVLASKRRKLNRLPFVLKGMYIPPINTSFVSRSIMLKNSKNREGAGTCPYLTSFEMGERFRFLLLLNSSGYRKADGGWRESLGDSVNWTVPS